jgi:dephospho-CoA kinase
MDGLGLKTARLSGLTIGLTGGIGSGKSTVARMLVACGGHLVDTDAIARALTQPGGAAMPALREGFGSPALAADGSLNRDHMRQLVFEDPQAKSRLEAVLHPLIGLEATRQATLAAGRPVIFDVPLLAESKGPRAWRHRVDRVLVIDCLEDTQAARVTLRPGWSESAARSVIAQQATRAARRSVADAVIFNDGISMEALQTAVNLVWQNWGPLITPTQAGLAAG